MYIIRAIYLKADLKNVTQIYYLSIYQPKLNHKGFIMTIINDAMRHQPLLETFNQYFEMIKADTDALKKEVYRLRYQVYCSETHFEDPTEHPDGMEYDEFDDNSIHYLIRHRKSKIYAATTRLILPDRKYPFKPFPIEIHSIIDNCEPTKEIPRLELGEVSRFCVSKEFKRRKNEVGCLTGINEYTIHNVTENERRIFPHLTFALIACLVKISKDNGIYYWYAVMEPSLLRFLSSLGIYFTGIGPMVDYHGKRKPGVIRISDLLSGVSEKNIGLWKMLIDVGSNI
ncbi:MAG: PEP-CTERM/exosortase system-associated acyltransferase [Gammaproteobacteria bacterium]